MKVYIKTIGCKLNQYESELLLSRFENSGFIRTSDKNSADICIINTCTVTAKADYKSRNEVLSACKNNPQAKIIVTGCYAKTDPQVFRDMPGVSLVEHNKEEIMYKLLVHSADITDEVKVFRSRPYVKIQDGCDENCSYCKTRIARGKSISFAQEHILNQIRTFTQQGFEEIVLVGCNIGAYKHHNINFVSLLKSIIKIENLGRIRLSSIEPGYFTDELLDFVASTDKICPHFHIPLQSGADKILRYMNRNYTVKEYINLIDKIKAKIKDVNIGTDIIVGFPYENDEEFQETVKVINYCEFGYMHIFKFSRRAGTEADNFDHQVDEKTKIERSNFLREIAYQKKELFRRKFIGRCLVSLIETDNKAISDNYIDIKLLSNKKKRGKLAEIFIEKVEGTEVTGRCV